MDTLHENNNLLAFFLVSFLNIVNCIKAAIVVQRLQRMREIGVRSLVGTDLSR